MEVELWHERGMMYEGIVVPGLDLKGEPRFDVVRNPGKGIEAMLSDSGKAVNDD